MENDEVVSTSVVTSLLVEEDNDDFQDPIPVLRRQIPSARPKRSYTRRVKEVVEATSSISENVGESSDSAATSLTAEVVEIAVAVEDIINQLATEELNEPVVLVERLTEEVDELTDEVDEEVDTTANIALTLNEPIENLVVSDIDTEEDDIPVVRVRGRRRAPRQETVKY